MTAKEDALKDIEWNRLKTEGSAHYHATDIQPIDLYKSLGLFRSWAIAEICQHALRNRDEGKPVSNKDMGKIIHYAKLLMAAEGEG